MNPSRLQAALVRQAIIAFCATFWIGLALCVSTAWGHEWWPPQCCNGGDCRVIDQSDVTMTSEGFQFPGNPETVPYNSPKIRQTPPEGNGVFGLCTQGGKTETPVICVYIPTWGS